MIEPINNQTVNVGASINVFFATSDSDGDPITAMPVSVHPEIATAEIVSSGLVRLTGIEPGTAKVTITLDDGRGGTASASFDVTVIVPNQNPGIAPIEPVTLALGETRDIGYAASDPDGDQPQNPVAISSDDGIASAFSPAVGTVTLTGNAPGTATVTVSVDDGRGGTASASFDVTVIVPNQNPVIAPIEPVTLAVGETRDIGYAASDPDGDQLQNPVAISSDDGIASAFSPAVGTVTVTGNAPGTATVTVSVDDGRGGTASASFAVTVVKPNQNPVIAPIEPVTLAVGETRDIGYAASDPDGDQPQNPVAISSDDGIASAFSPAVGTVTLTGNAPGTATVTVSVDDGRGGTASASFDVTVIVPNQNPGIAPIEPVTLAVGETRDIGYAASDPDGDQPQNPVAISSDDGIVSAFSPAVGTVTTDG